MSLTVENLFTINLKVLASVFFGWRSLGEAMEYGGLWLSELFCNRRETQGIVLLQLLWINKFASHVHLAKNEKIPMPSCQTKAVFCTVKKSVYNWELAFSIHDLSLLVVHPYLCFYIPRFNEWWVVLCWSFYCWKIYICMCVYICMDPHSLNLCCSKINCISKRIMFLYKSFLSSFILKWHPQWR